MERLMKLATDACREGGCTCSNPVTEQSLTMPGVGVVESVRVKHESACPLKLRALAEWN